MNETPETAVMDEMVMLEHAKDVRSDHTDNAEEARAVAASDWTDSGYAHWNLYRAMRQVAVSRLVAGNPRAQITTRISRLAEQYQDATQDFEDQLTIQYAREMLAALLRDAQGEACDTGNSYLYIDPWTGDIQFISYFDVWADNILARPSAMEEGRYIFWRCLMDQNEFNAKYEKQLKKKGMYPAQSGGEALEGRQIAGAKPGQKLVRLEDSTGVKEVSSGVPHVKYGDVLPADEGLVVYYKSVIRNGDGWVYKIWFEDQVLDEMDWPAEIGPPTFYCFAADGLSNQFYQPNDYNHVRGYQNTIDEIWARVKDNSKILGDPPFYWNKETDTYNNGKAALEDGDKIIVAPGDKPGFLEPPTLPNQYMAFVDNLINYARSLELPDVLQGQTDQTDVQSGVAIDSLRREADQRLQMRLNNQDENLRKIGKVLCKIIWLRRFKEAQVRAAQEITLSQQQQYQEQEELRFADAAFYREAYVPSEPPAEIMPEEVPDEAVMQFMGPLGTVDLQTIENDLVFSWEIEPKLTQEERMQQLLGGFQAATSIPGVAVSPKGFILMAGKIAHQTRLAEELAQYFDMYVAPEVQQAQLRQMQQQMQEQALLGQDGTNKETASAGQ